MNYARVRAHKRKTRRKVVGVRQHKRKIRKAHANELVPIGPTGVIPLKFIKKKNEGPRYNFKIEGLDKIAGFNQELAEKIIEQGYRTMQKQIHPNRNSGAQELPEAERFKVARDVDSLVFTKNKLLGDLKEPMSVKLNKINQAVNKRRNDEFTQSIFQSNLDRKKLSAIEASPQFYKIDSMGNITDEITAQMDADMENELEPMG